MKPIVIIFNAHILFASMSPIQAAQQDETAIGNVFANFSAIWNQSGMPGFEDLFAEDGRFRRNHREKAHRTGRDRHLPSRAAEFILQRQSKSSPESRVVTVSGSEYCGCSCHFWR